MTALGNWYVLTCYFSLKYWSNGLRKTFAEGDYDVFASAVGPGADKLRRNGVGFLRACGRGLDGQEGQGQNHPKNDRRPTDSRSSCVVHHNPSITTAAVPALVSDSSLPPSSVKVTRIVAPSMSVLSPSHWYLSPSRRGTLSLLLLHSSVG